MYSLHKMRRVYVIGEAWMLLVVLLEHDAFVSRSDENVLVLKEH